MQAILLNIPHDKLLHFGVSFLLLVIIFGIRKLLLKDSGLIRVFAYSFRDVLLIGIFKEIIDSLGFGNPEIGDILANISGIIAPVYIFYLIHISKKLKKSRKLLYEKKLILRFKAEKKALHKIKLFLFLSAVWFGNIIYLFLKIPFLALKETMEIFKESFFILRKQKKEN